MNEPQSITINGQQFWYTHYKEPFRQLKGALPGYPVGVPVVDEMGKLLCPWCDPPRTFDNFGDHARKTHTFFSMRELKNELGWMAGTSTQSQAMSEKHRRAVLARPEFIAASSTPERIAHIVALARGAQRAKKNTPELQNKAGRCHDQIVRVAKNIRLTQPPLTWAKLAEQGIYNGDVLREWGSYDSFRDEIGWLDAKPYSISRAEGISLLRQLAAELGRTPGTADLKGRSPSWDWCTKTFGSLSAAQQAAGLPPSTPDDKLSRRPRILLAYSLSGSESAAGRATGYTRAAVRTVLNSLGWPGAADPQRREWAADMAKRLAAKEELMSEAPYDATRVHE